MEDPCMQLQRHDGFVSLGYVRGNSVEGRQVDSLWSFDVSRELKASTHP